MQKDRESQWHKSCSPVTRSSKTHRSDLQVSWVFQSCCEPSTVCSTQPSWPSIKSPFQAKRGRINWTCHTQPAAQSGFDQRSRRNSPDRPCRLKGQNTQKKNLTKAIDMSKYCWPRQPIEHHCKVFDRVGAHKGSSRLFVFFELKSSSSCSNDFSNHVAHGRILCVSSCSATIML